MKLNCGPPLSVRIWDWYDARRNARAKWHRFFCLFPRHMTEFKNDCRWLEYIERRVYWKDHFIRSYTVTEYRPIAK